MDSEVEGNSGDDLKILSLNFLGKAKKKNIFGEEAEFQGKIR